MVALGAHMSSSGGFVKMTGSALRIGARTMQFFIRNPRGGKQKEIDEQELRTFDRMLHENAFAPVVVHAPYTMNVCSPREEVRRFGIDVLREDLERTVYFPGNLYNFHPGCAVGQAEQVAVERIADALNRVLTPDLPTTVLLETMAGKGSEIGSSFSQLRQILDRTELSDKVGVCLDTCHVWDAGYDIQNDLDGVLEELDRTIGIDRLRCIHLNGSLHACGSRKDRHARIGEGELAVSALVALMRRRELRELPFILETPTDDRGHKEEISRLYAMLAE